MTTFTQSKLPLWLLGLLFIIPVYAAYLTYASGYPQNLGSTHAGILINPAERINVMVKNLPLMTGKWGFLYIKPNPCTERCESTIALMNNMHTSLGKEQLRVRPLLVEIKDIFLGRKTHFDVYEQIADENILLLDTENRLLMIYTPEIMENNPKGILSDLRKLLKASQIG